MEHSRSKLPAMLAVLFCIALLAGVGAGIFSSHEEAVEKGLHLKERVEPDAKTAAKYQEIFKCYRELHDALTPLYHKF